MVIFRSIFKRSKDYMFFAVLGSAGSVIVLNIDLQMVTSLMSLEYTAIYSTAFYIAIVIEMPKGAIGNISAPIVAKSFEDNDISSIRHLYKRISVNQAIIGTLLFIGIVANLHDIFALIPKSQDYKLGFMVVIIIGIAKLIDMIFSINSVILMMSKYYKINILTIFILAICSILFNSWLIPIYGMEGAALASLLSLLLFNLAKATFVYITLKIHPFEIKTLSVLGIGAICYFASTFIPTVNNMILDILIRSSVITIMYISVMIGLKLSSEFNALIYKTLKKILPFK